jgi:glyoxylase-like metal-dependent hydrolase (beta-lactamase superfamily II)
MVTRLTENVWWLDFRGVNAYLVDEADGLTLVDTGMPWHGRQLRRDIRTVVDALSDVDRVIITHFDIDHVGGLDRLAGMDATLYVGAADEPYLAGREKPTWGNRKGALQRVTDVFRDPPDLPIETVEDGDTVGGFTAYHTPGHTPGHTSFVHEDLSAAFLGDLVRESDGEFERPPWFLNYDHDDARESILDFADRAPPVDLACPGHGTPFVTDGDERLGECAATLRAKPQHSG